MTSQPSSPRRGDIYWVDFNPARGSEQAGVRPAVVVSPDFYNSRMRTVLVAGITSTIRPASKVAVLLPAGKPLKRECQIMAFQIMTVDKSRLGDCKGCLDADQTVALENAMRAAWGL